MEILVDHSTALDLQGAHFVSCYLHVLSNLFSRYGQPISSPSSCYSWLYRDYQVFSRPWCFCRSSRYEILIIFMSCWVISIPDKNNQSALHLAISHNYILEIVDYLVDHSSVIDLQGMGYILPIYLLINHFFRQG